MQIVVNRENKELIYELINDEESIKNLISEIIKNCSIRKESKCYIAARTYNEAEAKINSSTDWNGVKIYENVSNICEEPINDPFDYWRHGDPKTYSFTARKLIIPQLVYFLKDILKGKYINPEWFINREELNKKQELHLEIKKLDYDINQISNFDTERKIKMLKELANKLEYLNNFPNFNYELLSKYYDISEDCIKLELIQETIKYQKKLAQK